MNKETLPPQIEISGLKDKVCGINGMNVVVLRDLSGRIINIKSLINGSEDDFTEVDGRLILESRNGRIVVEQQPPIGLQRERSGHSPIPVDRQCWIVDFDNGFESLTTSLPVVAVENSITVCFTALENEQTRLQQFLPFSLTVNHPDLSAQKTDVVSLLQIFGHASAAVRMLQVMSEPLRSKTFLAAKNTDNVPKTMARVRNSISGLPDDFLIPLTYDDGTSGGPNLLNRKAAIWWLAQNPELVDTVMHSQVVISDFREEVAILKQIADNHDLPQIFLGLTYLWPQRLNELRPLHPELQLAKDQLATPVEKLRSMAEVGLREQDAVVDWFSWARRWKAGVQNNRAHAVDLLVNFGLISPFTRPPDIENCAVLPPRTKLENSDVSNLWTDGMRRILVTIGSGDWTEREIFTRNLIQAAEMYPDCEFVIVGNNENFNNGINVPDNVRQLGTVDPQFVDKLIASCELTVIKPGHFSLEETAGKPTLVASSDNIRRAVEISKKVGSPRAVAIAVEVDEERFTNAVELWCAMGSPSDFAPIIDISTPQSIADKIRETLEKSPVLLEKLTKVPNGGTEALVSLINSFLESRIDRTNIGEVVQGVRSRADSVWKEGI